MATFHRFCGDDETFFVATMMTRPIGLETAFAIQLADKQPVLRGLCVVLDAWNTPENRFKRPGIRLGIKRLTADSQPVFARLKAASREPVALADASPPPGLRPLPPVVGEPRRGGAGQDAPALPSLVGEPRRGGAGQDAPALPPMVGEPSRGGAGQDAPALPPVVAPQAEVAAAPAHGAEPAPAAAGTRPPVLAGKPAMAPTTRPLRGAEPRPRAAEGTAPPVRVRPSVFDAKTAPGTPPVELRGRSEERSPAPVADGSPLPVVDGSPLPAAPVVPTSAEQTTPLLVAVVPTSAEQTTPLLVAPTLTSDSTTDVLPVPPTIQHAVEALIVSSARPRAGAPAPSVLAPTPSVPPVEPVLADPAIVPAPDARAAAPGDPTLGVTRFQVALHVGTIPPPVGEIEFQPRQAAPRRRKTGSIALDSAALASLPDRDGELVVGTPAIARSGELVIDGAPISHSDEPATTRLGAALPGDPAARAASEGGADRESAADLRTPGSALVLPANPLHDLTDQSLEGFVDCTIYEESGNIFHPSFEISEWVGETGERRVDAVPRAMSPQRSTGPVLAAAPIHGAMDAMTGAAVMRPDPNAPAATVVVSPMPHELAARGPVHPRMGTVPPALASDAPGKIPDGELPWRVAAGSSGDARLHPPVPPPRAAAGSQVQSAAHAAAQLIGLGRAQGGRELAPWLRWGLIAGSTLLAIVLAFVTARVVRGPDRGSTSPAELEPPHPPPTADLAPAPAPPVQAPAAPPSVARASVAPAPVGKPRAAPPVAPAPAPSAPAASDDPAITAVASVKLASRAAAGPVVGSGPCRFSIATTPASSQIRLDDQTVGVSPLVIAASCDHHKLEVSHARYQSITRTVTLSPEHPQELEVSLPRPIHTVTVTSFPPGARLTVDGRAAGTTPAVVQIVGFSVVSLTLAKPGFPTVTRKLYSKLAQDRVFVKLSPER